MQVANTGASNAIAGSSLSQVATASRWSRLIHAIASPCCVSRESIALPCMALSASRTFADIGLLVGLGGLGDQLLALLAQLAVTAARLDAIHEHDQRVEHLLWPRRAPRDVDVHRDPLIGARHRVIVLVDPAGRRAHAERDHPLGLGHLVEH